MSFIRFIPFPVCYCVHLLVKWRQYCDMIVMKGYDFSFQCEGPHYETVHYRRS